MIRGITIINHLGEELALSMTDPTSVAITNIDGIGPVKADINSIDLATDDGAIFNSARLGTRNLVFTLLYLWSPTIEDARQMTYRYFPVKKPVTVMITTNNRKVKTTGYVESNETTMFSKTTGSQISIICPDPMLYSTKDYYTMFSGVDQSFTFPFSNESTSEKLINLGEIRTNQERSVYYYGDDDIGFTIVMHSLGAVSDVVIYDTLKNEHFKINSSVLATITGSGIIAGDDIIISTVAGDKYITLVRDGIYTNILNCIDLNSDWFHLTHGENRFLYVAATGVENLQFVIYNKVAYEGV